MSHTITIQLANKQIHINNCNNFIQQINEMVERSKKLNNIDLTHLLNETNRLLNIINTKDNYTQQEHMQLLRDLSTLEKNVANSFSFVKNSLKEKFFDDILKANEFNLLSKIQQHGILTNEVIEYLNKNNIKVNDENFGKYLPIVEGQSLNEDKIKKYISESFKYIDDLKMNDELKLILKKDIKSIKDLNQLKDINAIIQSKEREYQDVMFLAKDVTSKLKDQGFQIDNKQKKIWQIDEQNNIVLKMSLINNQNNSVQIIFNSNLQIKYKLGNYVGHACEKTTDKLLKDLETSGYTYSVVNIKRDYEEPKTMQKSIEKERGK